jgi:large subunit ribosomal protein L6
MSRIGKLPIPLPRGVTATLSGSNLAVKGPKGELKYQVQEAVSVKIEPDVILVQRPNESREARSFHGMVRSVIANMVEGVSKGFVKTLEINGVGYKSEVVGPYLRFDLGYSHPIFYRLPKGVAAEVVKGVTLTLSGIDKVSVGRSAATIRSLRKPEPYKGKGIKYSDEIIVRKVGKAGAK